jgi:hypothetical protein
VLTAASSAVQALGGESNWLPVGVVAAIIAGAFLLWNGWRQRRHESRGDERQAARTEREASRERLGPELRTLIHVGEQLEGITVRLTHNPANEVQHAGAALDGIRQQLKGVLEPELFQLREEFHLALTDVILWWSLRKGIDEDLSSGRQINLHQHERIDRFEAEQRAQVRTLTDRSRAMLQEL